MLDSEGKIAAIVPIQVLSDRWWWFIQIAVVFARLLSLYQLLMMLLCNQTILEAMLAPWMIFSVSCRLQNCSVGQPESMNVHFEARYRQQPFPV
jgi:hypothetical protein